MPVPPEWILLFNFKPLYTITTSYHMVVFGQVASHTPKPLSLRVFKLLVRSS